MFKKFRLLILLNSFSILYCLQEDKYEYETKKEDEYLQWVEKRIYDKNSSAERNKRIVALCKLSKRRIAIANQKGCIKIFNIDSGQKEKDIHTNDKDIKNIIAIPGNKLVIVSYEANYLGWTEFFFGPTIIKVINLDKSLSKQTKEKEIKLNVEEDFRWRAAPKKVTYLKEDKLVVTYWDKTFLLNLDSANTIQLDPKQFSSLEGITYAKQLADGSLVCRDRFHPGRIKILSPDFRLIQSMYNNNEYINHLKIFNNKQAFIVSTTRCHTPLVNSQTHSVLIYTNEKFNFDEIKKNLNNKITLPYLQQIILDYLSNKWLGQKIQNSINLQGTIYSIPNHLEHLNFTTDNKIINKMHLGGLNFVIQLWNFKPLKFIKKITETDGFKEKYCSYKDGTIVICDEYSVKVLEPIYKV